VLIWCGEIGRETYGLCHSNNCTLLQVEDSVLLEDWGEHGLDNDARARAGNEARLLVQLLGEEVDTEVTVLTSGWGGGDADNLAWATLEDEDIASADVVGWNSNRVWDGSWVGGGAARRGRGGDLNIYFGATRMRVASMKDTVSCTMETVAEGVIVTCHDVSDVIALFTF
jgi:hypothetical protein